MSTKIIWKGKQFNKKLYKDVDKKMSRMAKAYAGFIKSVQGSPGFPGIVTGELKNSLTSAKIGLMNYGVGTDKEYARFLEFGTSRMSPLPLFRNSLNMFKRRMGAMLKWKR